MSAHSLPIPTGSLYVLVDHLAALIETVESCEDPELRKQGEEEIKTYLEAEIRKVDSVRGYLRQCEAQEQLAKEEKQKHDLEAKRWAARRERVEQYVINVLKTLDKPELKGRTGTFSLKGCPPSVIITDEAKIPAQYKQVETTVSIKKKEIADAIKKGIDVDGADLEINKKRLDY